MIKKEYVEFITFTVNKSSDVSIDLKQSATNHNVNNYLVDSKHSTNLGTKRGDTIFRDYQ